MYLQVSVNGAIPENDPLNATTVQTLENHLDRDRFVCGMASSRETDVDIGFNCLKPNGAVVFRVVVHVLAVAFSANQKASHGLGLDIVWVHKKLLDKPFLICYDCS